LDQVANSHFAIADVGEKQGLDTIDVAHAESAEFDAEDIEQAAMKPFD
jgi:hypothetical protein